MYAWTFSLAISLRSASRRSSVWGGFPLYAAASLPVWVVSKDILATDLIQFFNVCVWPKTCNDITFVIAKVFHLVRVLNCNAPAENGISNSVSRLIQNYGSGVHPRLHVCHLQHVRCKGSHLRCHRFSRCGVQGSPAQSNKGWYYVVQGATSRERRHDPHPSVQMSSTPPSGARYPLAAVARVTHVMRACLARRAKHAASLHGTQEDRRTRTITSTFRIAASQQHYVLQ